MTLDLLEKKINQLEQMLIHGDEEDVQRYYDEIDMLLHLRQMLKGEHHEIISD